VGAKIGKGLGNNEGSRLGVNVKKVGCCVAGGMVTTDGDNEGTSVGDDAKRRLLLGFVPTAIVGPNVGMLLGCNEGTALGKVETVGSGVGRGNGMFCRRNGSAEATHALKAYRFDVGCNVNVGRGEGSMEGSVDGKIVGVMVGVTEGLVEGIDVTVGASVGINDGSLVGGAE
jgi:hypothetical protein